MGLIRWNPCEAWQELDVQDSVAASCKEGLRWLVDHKLIVWDRSRNAYAAAPLGKATLAAGLDPDAACLIKKVLLVCTPQQWFHPNWMGFGCYAWSAWQQHDSVS